MVNNVKRFYLYAYETNDIFKKSFKKTIDLTGFDDFLLQTKFLTDVDILQAEKLMKECNAWISYLTDLNGLILIYLDRFKNVQDFQKAILEIIKKEKRTPTELIKRCKIESSEIGDVVAEVIKKEQETSDKIKTIRIFSQMINSYIKYLRLTSYKLLGIAMGGNSRYWNII